MSAPRRKQKYYFWRSGMIPLEEVFMKRHSELQEISYEDAYNEVVRVMVTLQDMLLTHPRFMLPGIGIIGISENKRRGISLSTSTQWYTPGLVNVLAAAPGWENAPLNSYLTEDLLIKLNKQIANLRSEHRKLLSPNQFYMASDFNMEFPTSLDKLEFYSNADTKAKLAARAATKARRAKKKSKEKRMQERIEYLEGLIEPDIEIEPFLMEEPDD